MSTLHHLSEYKSRRRLPWASLFTVHTVPLTVWEVKSVMGGCLHDRLLTVGVFYSQQKQAIDDTLASSRSDTASTETTEWNSAVHQTFSNSKCFIWIWIWKSTIASVNIKVSEHFIIFINSVWWMINFTFLFATNKREHHSLSQQLTMMHCVFLWQSRIYSTQRADAVS